ncbi:MAG: Ig-like domain repeat protein [Verrucomicrobia bacterium]|nr:Ig-like domain repeat protein [Verrucomicrobiota bacterium]
MTPTSAGSSKTITATYNSVVGTTTITTVNPGPTSVGQSTVSASPTTLVADGSTTSTITVTFKDAYNNPVPNRYTTVTKTSGPGTPTITGVGAGSPYTDSSGVATFTVKSTTAGTNVFTAQDFFAQTNITQTASVIFTAGVLDHFAISSISSPQTVGAPITGITLTAQDAHNNTCASGPNEFSGTVAFGGTAGVTGTSAAFTAGVLSGVSVTPTLAGSGLTLTVNDGSGHSGSTSIATVNKGAATVTLGSLSQTYDSTARVATATTTPGSYTTAPINAGSYEVIGTIADANYQGSATNTLVVSNASLTLTAGANVKVYDGTTSATNVPIATGLQGSDTVSGTTVVYDTADVGTGKTLSITGYTVNDGNAGNNYTVSTVTSTTGEIDAASTLTTLVSDINPALPGSNVTFTATVSAVAPGGGTPTGIVQFMVDGVNAGTPVTLSGGQASYSTSVLAHGNRGITAEFACDTANYNASTNSPALNQVINTPPVAQDIDMGAQADVPQTLLIINGKYAPTDAANDTLTLASVSQGTNGGVVAISGDSVTYSNSVVGDDSFQYAVSDGFATVTNVVMVTVTAVVNQQTPSISYNGTNIVVKFWGVPGYPYTIQSTTNLNAGIGWQDLIPPVTANDTNTQPYGQISYTDTNSVSSPSWFYRLKP